MAGYFKWKIKCKKTGYEFVKLDSAIQEVIMKLLPGDQYKSFTYYIGSDYIGCKQGQKIKFLILRNHHGDFATVVSWPIKLT